MYCPIPPRYIYKKKLQDTSDFLRKIEQIIWTEGMILGTFDVQSLYTNIPNEEGIAEVRWKCAQMDCELGRNTEYTIKLLRTVLYNNFFRFNEDYYLQIKGTAMGASMAPAYANIFMSWLEDTRILNSREWQEKGVCWWRYIDDVFVIWRGNEQDLKTFGTHLNTLHTCIKFTLDTQVTSVHFLDTVITIDGASLSSDLYIKPTDVNSMLHATSHHARNTFSGLPKSQFLRIKRIVSKQENVDNRMNSMEEKFLSRGYNCGEVQKAKMEVMAMTRQQAIQIKPKKSLADRLVFVSTFSLMSRRVEAIIKKHWAMLRSDPNLHRSFAQLPLFSHKKNTSIKEILVKADVQKHRDTQTFLDTPKKGTFPCRACVVCNNITRGDTFTHPRSGKVFKIKGYYTCTTDHVIYLIKCPCGMGYVGETTRAVKVRIGEHKSAIRTQDKKSPVARHFAREQHSIAQLRFQILEQVERLPRGGDRERKLRQREAFWVDTLDTLFPKGMNETNDFACYLPIR